MKAHTHTHTYAQTPTFFWQSLCASMHTNWHSILLLVLSRPPLLACLPPHTSGFLKAFPCPAHTRRSVSVFFFFNPCFHLKSANVDGVGGVFHLRRQLLSNSLPSLSVFHPPSLQVPPPSNQTPLMNREVDTCEKATTTLKMSGNVPQNLRLVTCHLLNGTEK